MLDLKTCPDEPVADYEPLVTWQEDQAYYHIAIDDGCFVILVPSNIGYIKATHLWPTAVKALTVALQRTVIEYGKYRPKP
mgnify:CR=1 FL=1